MNIYKLPFLSGLHSLRVSDLRCGPFVLERQLRHIVLRAQELLELVLVIGEFSGQSEERVFGEPALHERICQLILHTDAVTVEFLGCSSCRLYAHEER